MLLVPLWVCLAYSKELVDRHNTVSMYKIFPVFLPVAVWCKSQFRQKKQKKTKTGIAITLLHQQGTLIAVMIFCAEKDLAE